MGLSAKTYKKLEKITGKNRCSQKSEDCICYSYDAITKDCMPDAVVFPENVDEISKILKLANEENFFVIPRGSGTGTTGGSLPVKGGVVLVLTGLNRIVEIDTDNYIAVVEPGVITGDFHKAVEAKGLFYPPDPSSSAFSTLGGNIAECAGGPKAVKYGVTKDYILGLEAVLPTGEIIKTGVRTAKGVVGYDLTKLITGSEGTLAVITSVTIKLIPLPETIRTMTAVFSDIRDAAVSVTKIMKSGIVPRAVEYLDNASIVCAESYAKMGLPVEAGAMLIIEADGKEPEADIAIKQLGEICKSNGASEIKIATDKAETIKLWDTRKAVSPALYMYGPDKINEDIVVPRNKIPLIVKKIEALKKKTGLTMVSFGHAGDGNIHFNIMLDKKDKNQLHKAEMVVEEIFDYTIEIGGTLSGEHGVGIKKSRYITKEIGPTEITLMKNIKKTFDPNNILNPGKIFY